MFQLRRDTMMISSARFPTLTLNAIVTGTSNPKTTKLRAKVACWNFVYTLCCHRKKLERHENPVSYNLDALKKLFAIKISYKASKRESQLLADRVFPTGPPPSFVAPGDQARLATRLPSPPGVHHRQSLLFIAAGSGHMPRRSRHGQQVRAPTTKLQVFFCSVFVAAVAWYGEQQGIRMRRRKTRT